MLINSVCAAIFLFGTGAALAQTSQQQAPPDELTSLIARQWAIADATCRRDFEPTLAQVKDLQSQLAEARKQIEELKKPAPKDKE